MGVVSSGVNPSASTITGRCFKFFQKYNKLKSKPCSTFIIGGHPTVLPHRSLRETKSDFVIIGEGYQAVEGLYNHVKFGKKLSSVPGIGYIKKIFILKINSRIN